MQKKEAVALSPIMVPYIYRIAFLRIIKPPGKLQVIQTMPICVVVSIHLHVKGCIAYIIVLTLLLSIHLI